MSRVKSAGLVVVGDVCREEARERKVGKMRVVMISRVVKMVGESGCM